MKFIPVIGKISPDKSYYDRVVMNMTESCLFSLIDGFSQKEFGLDTIYKTKRYVRRLREEVLKPAGAGIFIDSGGYSFIKGDINPSEVMMMIECYTDYLRTEIDEFDFIFSLDLPVSLKYERFNTKDKVYKYNRISLERSLELLKQNPGLAEKFYFVWQFKLRDQYEIWKKLCSELRINDLVKNRAIGGMVSLRKMANIAYSPFIAMAYKCLRDYWDAQDSDHDFRLHFLGVNNVADRFIILMLERLFRYYFNCISHDQEIILTYDSINCRISAMKQARNLKVHDFNNGKLIEYKMDNIPDELIGKTYGDGQANENIHQELENLRNGRKLNESDCLVPFNVHTHLSINRFLEWIIDKYGLADDIIISDMQPKYERSLKSKLGQLAKTFPKTFTRTFCRNLKESLTKVYKMHYWHHKEQIENDRFDTMITAYTQMINAPGSLK